MSHDSNHDRPPCPSNVTPAYIAAGHYAPSASPQPIIIQPGRGSGGMLLGTFAMLGWMAFGLCAMFLVAQLATLSDYFDTSGGITEKHHSGAKYADNKVAIISVTGVILEGEGFVKNQIDRVRDDSSVKALVVRVDSPGGTVTGSDYIFHHLNKLRQEKGIPLVVSMGSIAASGGYYVSMAVGDQANSIYAEPTTTTSPTTSGGELTAYRPGSMVRPRPRVRSTRPSRPNAGSGRPVAGSMESRKVRPPA